MKRFYFFLLLLMISGMGWSQTTTWTNGNSNNRWDQAGNWSAGVPVANSVVVFNNNTTINVINVATGGNLTLRELRVEGNTNITLVNAGNNRTLSIGNNTANSNVDFMVEAGSSLTLSGANGGNGVNITLIDNSTGTTTGTIAGDLFIGAGRTLTVNNTNTVTTVTGNIDNSGTVTASPAGLNFSATGTYIHSRDGGGIPLATWNAASTCLVTGVTSNVPTNTSFEQAFGHFTWDCPGQTSDVSLAGYLETVNGNFTMTNTGSGALDLVISGFSPNLAIAGDYIHTGGTFVLHNNSGTTNVLLQGNFNMSGGTLRRDGGTCNFVFDRTGAQTFTKTGGTIGGVINFRVDNLSVVNFGTSVLDGVNATFTLDADATFITAHPDGLSSTASTGAIQVGGNKVYSTGANYEFRGANTGVFNTGGVNNTTASQVENLTINNTTSLSTTLSKPVTVNGVLTLIDGELNTTATNILTVANNATVTGASNNSFVNGPIAKAGNDAFVFPVGRSGAGYVPISMSAPGSMSSVFTAEYFRGVPPNSGNISAPGIQRLSACEYWSLVSSGTPSNLNIVLNWNANSPCNGANYVTNPSAIRAVRYNGSSSWNLASPNVGGGSAAAGTAPWNGVLAANFGFFTLGTTPGTDNPLPVMFSDVMAYAKNSGVQVEWSNLTERDILHYSVERSSNGTDFSEIQKYLPTSNQDDKASYTHFDASPRAGVNYYRIKVYEKFGKMIYSKILRVEIGNVKTGFSLYPNPVTGNQLTISLTGIRQGQYSLRVINAAGQDVYRSTLTNNGTGVTQMVVLPSTIKPGVYTSIITGADFQANKMFIVQ